MKKIFTFLSVTALLLTGCAKENLFSKLGKGEPAEVTFSVQVQDGTPTRAVADGDGAAANVNRCIMEVYYGDELFTREYAQVTGTITKTANFSVQLVSNRTYKVAFWADCVEDATTEEGREKDNYYTTTNGLGAIELKGTYAGSKDDRDAFARCTEYEVKQGGSSFNAVLKRPFAQINVITTDVAIVKKAKGGAIPETVNVTLKGATKKYSVLDSTAVVGAGSTGDLNYEASLYKMDTTKAECTLSMDYIFAEAEKAVIDIDWKAKKSGDTPVSHSFASVPYQRNYRTNIKGALLTTTGQWNVTVDPIWEGEHAKIVEVADIKSANAAIVANASTADVISVKFKAEPNDSGVPTGEESSPSRAILTSPIATGATLSVEVQTNTATLYVGDYQNEYDVNTMATSTNPAVVNINVPQNTKIGKLVVNAPSKSVFLNGLEISNVGVFDEVDAITSQNTLIIAPEQTVKKLIIRKGGLEIHGTVNEAEVIPESVNPQVVFVRDCENLIPSVYAVLEPYIDVENGYTSKQNSDHTWNILLCDPVAKIGQKTYHTIYAAADDAQDDDTIVILRDITLTKYVNITKNVDINLNGHTITGPVVEADYSYGIVYEGYISTDPSHRIHGKVYNGTVSCNKCGVYSADHSDVIVEDLTINQVKTKAEVKFNHTALAASYGATLTVKNGTYSGDYAASIFSTGGTITIENGTFTGTEKALFACLPSSHEAEGNSEIVVTGGNINGSFTIQSGTGAHGYVAGMQASGGTFTTDPSDYTKAGYGAQDNENGTWTVLPNWITLFKGETKLGDYFKLEDAIKAWTAQTEAVDYSIVIDADDNVNLHKVNATALSDASAAISQDTDKKSLTIKAATDPVYNETTGKVTCAATIRPYNVTGNQGIFNVSGCSSFNNKCPITITGLFFDMSAVQLTSTTASNRIFVVLCQHGNTSRYAHDITVDKCKFVGFGGKVASVVGSNKNNSTPSAITISNCEGEKMNCWFNGYLADNAGFGMKIQNCISKDFLCVLNNQSTSPTIQISNLKGNFFYEVSNIGASASASTEDGLIYTNGGTLSLEDIDISAGTPKGYGGAVYVKTANAVTITTSNVAIEKGAKTYQLYAKVATSNVKVNGQDKTLTEGSGINDIF